MFKVLGVVLDTQNMTLEELEKKRNQISDDLIAINYLISSAKILNYRFSITLEGMELDSRKMSLDELEKHRAELQNSFDYLTSLIRMSKIAKHRHSAF